jgi:GT2 family glycosyltransferase/glycosyltransferase involved in cell wall biosynthesis
MIKGKNKMKEFLITQRQPPPRVVPPKPAPPTSKEQFLNKAEQQLDAFLSSGKKLVFPFFEKPEVSIIIVTYTQTDLELLCLMALRRWVTDCSYEVVISNNGTSERNKELLSRLENVKIIYNEENKGFVGGVNIGAENASGDYLLLLNDDALVTYNCVQSLLKRIRNWKQNNVAVVGAQIRTLDNNIQDAGGILRTDGQAEEYSKGRNPDIGDVNFVRETDYVSGSCFMTPRELFMQLNKFDEIYSPGYCEESDYCLRARKAGYKIIYDPNAKILHYEYGSSDPSKVSSLVEEHTKILKDKHQDILSRGYSISTPVVHARTNKKYRGRVLIIDNFIPRPAYGDNKIIDYIKELVNKDFFVTFFPIYNGVDDWMSVYDWLPDTVEVMLYEQEGVLERILAERPRFYDYFISKVYNFSPLLAKSVALQGKYVLQLREDEDFDCSRLREILSPTVLWVDWHIPEYDTNAGDYAVYSYCSQLQELGYRIRYWSDDTTWRNQNPKYIQFLEGKDWEFLNKGGYTFGQTLIDLGHTIDLVVLARPLAINYIETVRKTTKAPIIYYCHDLHHLRELRQMQTLCTPDYPVLNTESVQNTKKVEYDIIRRTDLLVTVSQFEKEYINKELPDTKVSVWPWYCPLKTRDTQLKTIKRILFLGGLQHTPNMDAIKWFLGDIYPLVKREWSDVTFDIAGSHIPKEIQDLEDGESIRITGFVEDLNSYFDSDSIFVAPIRFGAGLKGKIAMALSYGVPVITTSLGAEGIGLVHGENVLIADSAEDFARQIIRTKESALLWNKISSNAVRFVKEHWSAEAVQQHLKEEIGGLDGKL